MKLREDAGKCSHPRAHARGSPAGLGPLAEIAGLTFALAEETVAGQVETDQIAADLESDPLWRRWDLILTVVLIIGVGIIWLYFTG